MLISLFSFGFLVSCDSVSWAEENSEYINSITSKDFQSDKEQKLADEASALTNGFYTCGAYDKKILDAIYKYRKQKVWLPSCAGIGTCMKSAKLIQKNGK